MNEPAGAYQQAGTKIHGLSQYATQAQSGLSADLTTCYVTCYRSNPKARAKKKGRENMPTKEIRGVFMTRKFLYLLFTLGRFQNNMNFHLVKNFDQFNRQKMCCNP